MSTVGRLNIDVTATTGKFDAAMAGVRKQVAGVGRAGAAASAIGGVSMPGFGALGGIAGLSGPLIAVTGGLAALTAAMRDRQNQGEKAKDAMDLAITQGLSFAQAQTLMGAGSQVGSGGEGVLKLLQAATSGTGMEAIAGGTSQAFADKLRSTFESGDFARAISMLQDVSGQANRMDIAKGLGGSGADFLRLQRASLGVGMGLDEGDAEYAMRRQNFEAGNPGFMTRFFNGLMELFGRMPNADLSREQTLLLRQIASSAGPGL